MKIFHTKEFSNKLDRLPKKIQVLYKTQEEIFVLNWKDPRLHTKKLKGKDPYFSFRVSRKYRVLFMLLDESSFLIITIGHRKNIYD